jgi:hypothetical protein
MLRTSKSAPSSTSSRADRLMKSSSITHHHHVNAKRLIASFNKTDFKASELFLIELILDGFASHCDVCSELCSELLMKH